MIKKGFKMVGVMVLSVSMITSGLVACSESDNSGKAREITVSAAASLTEALTEIGEDFETDKGVELNINFGSSGALQKQIEEGAPTDVFLSAGQSQMDALEEAELLKDDSRSDILENSLVLIASSDYADRINSVEDLVDIDEKIAIAETETVPVGQYTRESLENLDMWDELESKFVYAKDVKAVLAYVEKGEVSAGWVYSSDARDLQSARLVGEIDPTTYTEIVYPIGILEGSDNVTTAQEFIDYLREDSSVEIFKAHGFKVR